MVSRTKSSLAHRANVNASGTSLGVLLVVSVLFFVCETVQARPPPADYFLYSPQEDDRQMVGDVGKRSPLTKVPPWVKWSLENAAQRRPPTGAASTPPKSLVYDRSTRDMGNSMEALTADSPENTGWHTRCFLNPVSCFGIRPQNA